MMSRVGYRAVPWASGPPTLPAAPQAGRLRRPLLHALTLATMLLVAVSLAALPACAYVGDLHNLRTTGGDYVMSPDVSYDWSTGEYLAVWQDDWNNSGDIDVYAQACYGDGTLIGAPSWLASSSDDELMPKVASVGSGSWLVTWVKRTASGDELYGRVMFADGTAGPALPRYLLAPAGTTITSLDIGATTATTDGWYLIVYGLENASGDGDIRRVIALADGSFSSEGGISTDASFDDTTCSVNQIGYDFLVAWQWSYPTDGSTTVWGNTVGGDTGALGSEIEIHNDHSTTDGDGKVAGISSVASDGAAPEHYLVTYAHQLSGLDFDIGYAFVSAGAVESTGILPTADTTGFEYQSSASFTGLTDTFFVAWQLAANVFAQADVLGTYLKRDGSCGPAEALAADSVVSESAPQSSCAWTERGDVAVVWNQWVTSAWDTKINERDWWLLTAELHDDGPEYQSFTPTSVAPGTPWTAECDIANDGGVGSGPFAVTLYASADTVFDPMADYYIGTVWMPNIAAGASADCNWTGSFGLVPPGTYWVFWRIDSLFDVPEYNKSDNVTYLSAYQLTVGEGLNLLDDGPFWRSFTPTTVAPGDLWTVKCDVRNGGNLAAGPFAVRVYASPDTTIDASDYLIAEVPMPGLAGFARADCDWSGSFPNTVPGGTFHVGWIIDPANAVVEGNEDDNTAYLSAYQLTVHAPPIAMFFATPTTVAPGMPVAFAETSGGAIDTWAWNFDDPASGAANTSSLQNPTHTYAAEGVYDVTLTVTNGYGTDTWTEPNYITVVAPVAASFSVTNAAGIVPLAVTFTDTSTGGATSWSWDFGDGTPTSAEHNPTHTYADPGYYSVTLTATKDLSTDVEVKAGCVAAGFTDTLPDYWAFHYILACATADMVQGYWENKYKPTEEVNRGQMAVYLARALAGGDELVPDPPATPTFTDVDALHWAYRYVEYVADLGVVQGYGGGTYKPDVVVNRGQMAVFIARAVVDPPGDAGVPEPSASDPAFPDVTATNDWGWCYKYVQYIAALDPAVVSGYPSGNYRPEVNVTRDQMAAYVQRAFSLPMYAPAP